MDDDSPDRPVTAFSGVRLIGRGPLAKVAVAIPGWIERNHRSHPVQVFDDATGAIIDLDLRGTAEEIVARLTPEGEPRGRGRPKLGVSSREVTLLPRQWDWLMRQPGGASTTLRRLVDAARKEAIYDIRAAQAAAYKFAAVKVGHHAGFEEAARALFAGDHAAFRKHSIHWWPDVRAHVERLAWRESPTDGGTHRDG
ncbi:DUF2239 family protein [Sphingoaurantiacus capsulatus]|uniref:DUF2239 family protein n=1 Tax=Sphingoaurantiacus capsulatus TaxID=1771310 RepID=A0ABV7XBU2_9SPHN